MGHFDQQAAVLAAQFENLEEWRPVLRLECMSEEETDGEEVVNDLLKKKLTRKCPTWRSQLVINNRHDRKVTYSELDEGFLGRFGRVCTRQRCAAK